MVNEYYNYLGYGITDSNGVAHLEFDENGDPLTHSYTGVGAGEIDVVASLDNPIVDGSIVSGTYPFIDSIFYDKGLDGTGNHNDNWWTNGNISVSRGSTYTTISENSNVSAQYTANNNNGVFDDFCIEWDNHLASATNDYIILTGTSDRVKTFSELGITGNCHVKITVVGTDVTIKVDNGTPITTSTNRDSNGKVKFRFQIADGGSDIGYSNFVIYSI